MNSQRYQKRRKKKNNLPVLFAGLLIAGLAFVFTINLLSDSPNTEEQRKDNAQVSKEEFIDRISPHAQELQSSYGVLPSIIIGQAILESNWGQSTLASKYNNLFGIKAYGDQKKVNLETKEYINEEWIVIQGDFRVYDTWEESMNDHTRLFVDGVTWNPRLYERVLLAENYKEAAQALQDAGYATDPTYAEKVIHVIESYSLDKYDY
ncbi:N-acetylmuramoyl-L-alanine amidase [Erwinia sp. CPCC 100877]|nr:N-acetylmuramoyl-L-alanine amidase [Erwinia sp. CPCC 100877]